MVHKIVQHIIEAENIICADLTKMVSYYRYYRFDKDLSSCSRQRTSAP